MGDFVGDTRDGYDAIAVGYAEYFEGEMEREPYGLAMLGAFAQVVQGRVVDVGCGPGWVTGFLAERGVDVYGVDLSAGMLDVARKGNPGLRFVEGSMTALDEADGSLGGVVAWYSVIHMPPERVVGVFEEFWRVLRPGGHLLLGFQVGDEPLLMREAFGIEVTLDFHRFRPERVEEWLEKAGFAVHVRFLREPDGTGRSSQVPQAHMVARKVG